MIILVFSNNNIESTQKKSYEISKLENNLTHLNNKIDTIATKNRLLHSDITELRKGKKRQDFIIEKLVKQINEQKSKIEKNLADFKSSNDSCEL